MKKKKYIVWSLVACLIMQIVITGMATAAGPIPDDLTSHPEYLVVHNTTDAYSESGGPSVIKVLDPDDNELYPTGNVYSDIPNGSTIQLTYRFNLDDGVSPDINTYSGSNYFYISLPEDITFDYVTGGPYDIIADPGTSSWLMGTWEFTDSHTIRVDFSDQVSSHLAMWGEIGLQGTFNDIEYGDETERTLVLGSESVIFRRIPPDPPQITLEKSGVYDAATNTIEWTVTVTPPDGWALDGYTLVDAYSANQTFVSNSFFHGATVADAGLDLTTANQISYTFPDTDPDTTGVQTIKYKTSPTSFSAEDGSSTAAEQSTFTNAATVKHAADTLAGPVTATVATNWISKTAANPSTNVIRWEVTASVPDGGSVTGAIIHDTLPIGMVLDTSHTVQISLNGGPLTDVESTSTNEWGKYSYTPGTSGSSGTHGILNYRFASDGAFSGSARLVYYTKVEVPDDYLKTNSPITFPNLADLQWENMPDPTNPPEDPVNGTIPGSGLISKSAAGGTENYNNLNGGYIHWTITVNRNKITMLNAWIGDLIAAGQELVIDDDDHAFIVSRNGTAETTYTSIPITDPNLTVTDSRNFSYSFPASFTDTYTLDYYTRIIDVSAAKNDAAGLDLLYANGNVNFGNGATLHRDGSTDDSSGPNKTFRSQMINKGVGAYNYSDHTIKWTVTVNRNRMPLTNATMTDLLPAGMDLLIDATHPFEVSVNGSLDPDVHAPTGIASDGRSFTYNFGAATTTDQYAISFYTHLQDGQLETEWSGTKAFINTSQLRGDEIYTHIDASATANIANPVISKDRIYVAGGDSIDWSVSINAGKIPLINAVVTDQLDPGLSFETASLKLYEVDVNPSTGAVFPASSGTLVTTGYTVDLPSTANSNTLTVHLPEGSSKVYRLEFTTFIISDDLDFVNEAVLSGTTNSPSGDDEAEEVVVNNLWSSGGSGSQQLTVYKDDGKGNPVPGSIYQLLNFNKQPILKSGNPVTATTDSHGNAVFTNLPAWVFYAKEVFAPDGFLLNPDVIGGERAGTDTLFTTADAPALGTISFNKTTHKGAALSGGEFTLTGEAYDGSDVTKTAASVGGIVTFSDVPLGTYTIRETRAPAGFYVSDTVLTAMVSYADEDRLAVKSEISADKIVDQPIPGEHFGSIGLKKTDETGKALAGAVFGLYNSDGALAQQAVSQSDGTVTFSHVTLGTYKIKEITPPAGHLASAREITVSIEDDGDIIDGGTLTNKTIYGSIRVVKTTDDGKTLLPGAQLSLYKKGGTEIVAQGVSGADGVVVFENLLYGDYVIRETKAPDGYTLSALEIPVSVKEDGKVVDAGTFVNTRIVESPKTGDDIMGYFVLALCSIAGIAVVYVISKRIKKIG